MNQYLRLTVIGTRRKADLALPSDHPIEELLPEIVALLEEPPSGGSPQALTTLIGSPIDSRTTFADQGVVSGAVLRLLPLDAAPQPPDVAEVTEAVADASAKRPDRWTPALTAIALGVVVALLSAATLGALPLVPGAAIAVSAFVFALGSVLGAVAARRGGPASVSALFGLGAGAALPLAGSIATASGIGAARDAALGAMLPSPVIGGFAWALIWVCAATVFGIGARRRGVIGGAVLALLTCAVVCAAAIWPEAATPIVAVAGVLAAAALGFAPSLALSAAGVARFDDAAIDEETVRRSDVAPAITAAFSAHTAIALALALPIAAATLFLSLGGPWSLGLAAALALFTLLRARLFPLAVARVALLLAGGLPAILWLISSPVLGTGWRIAIAAVACLAFLLAAVLPFLAAAQARFRRLLGTIEALTVITMVPLILGVLGLFGQLLGAFS